MCRSRFTQCQIQGQRQSLQSLWGVCPGHIPERVSKQASGGRFDGEDVTGPELLWFLLVSLRVERAVWVLMGGGFFLKAHTAVMVHRSVTAVCAFRGKLFGLHCCKWTGGWISAHVFTFKPPSRCFSWNVPSHVVTEGVGLLRCTEKYKRHWYKCRLIKVYSNRNINGKINITYNLSLL